MILRMGSTSERTWTVPTAAAYGKERVISDVTMLIDSRHTWKKRSEGCESIRRNDRDMIVSRVQSLKYAHSLQRI
jgi:hypothetical protein